MRPLPAQVRSVAMLKTWSVLPMPALSLRFVPLVLAGWWFRYEIALAVVVLAALLLAIAGSLTDAPGLDGAGWAGVLLIGALLARVAFLERIRWQQQAAHTAAYAILEA